MQQTNHHQKYAMFIIKVEIPAGAVTVTVKKHEVDRWPTVAYANT